MRIAMLLPSLANKGPVIVAKDLCEGLIELGHSCKIFYFDDIVELEMPCETEKITFWKALQFESFDVVHTHGYRPDAYMWFHRLGYRKNKDLKIVSTLHNQIDYRTLRISHGVLYSLIGDLTWKMFLNVFHHVVLLNPYSEKKLKGVKLPETGVIFNGRNISATDKISNVQDHEKLLFLKKHYKIIGTVSGINRRKGLEQIVRILPELKDFAFVAVGDGPVLHDLRELAIELNVADRCFWPGYRADGRFYQSYFDVFVMCSRSEGYPLALIEAAAFSKPTVLSDISILQSVITDKEVVFYELDNLKSLREAVLHASKNSDVYAYNINKYYRRFLTKDMMVKNYVVLYSK